MQFGDVLYDCEDRVATITPNRPERFNAISATMLDDIASAFAHADDDDDAHVIVLTGAGNGFCGGYDLNTYAEGGGDNPVAQDMPWDPMLDYRFMHRCTERFMSIWRCNKPVIARHSPEEVAFKRRAEEAGFKQAIAERGSGNPIPGSKR